jgi:hypothetical protein
MSLDTLLTQLGLQRRQPRTLEGQLYAMRHEVARLGRALSSQVGHGAHDLGGQLNHFSHDAARQTAHLADIASSQARRGAEMVRRDPLPLIAVVGTGLLIARLLRRR